MKYRFLPILIIVLITAFVFTTAGIMIGAGLASNSSNIKYISRASRHVERYVRPDKILSLLDFWETTDGHSEAVPIPTAFVKYRSHTCISELETYQGNSLVDYLHAKDLPADFSSRAALAEKFSISEYTGSEVQNQEILDRLLDAEACN
ncbi:MAG TPA: hypothetical protein VG941_00435 [Candidatus Paceibacterota bacterium]|nr:hypothetical protein [Candidatus Paceibacterota bacterium]